MMATSTVKGFVNDIESMCECTICYISYDEIKHIPRLLPCHHTLCTECLSKHCKGRNLKCPYCMKEHYVKNGDINIFPKDNTRRDLKELLEKFSQSLCGICRRHDHVKYFCVSCNIRMCRGCYKERKGNVCDAHDIEISEDSSITPDTSLESTENHSKDVCILPGHEKNELKFFCSEMPCSKPVCANCIVESHNEHDYRPIKEEYENRMKCMKSSCLATQSKITEAKKLLEIVRNKYLSLTESDRKGRENLSTEANRGIKYINNFEENTKKNSNEIVQKNLRELDRKKEQLQSFIENATECCAISEEALTGNNVITYLSVEKTLTDKLICFERSEFDKPLDPVAKEDFELQGPISELRERVERMTRDKERNPGGLNSFLTFWILFWEALTVPCMNCLLSMLGCLLLLILVILWFFQIPYAALLQTNDSYLAFHNSQASLSCYSKYGRIYSNIPMENMSQLCGKKNNQYVYKGAFTNTTFIYGKGEPFIFKADVSRIKIFSPGLILFEFGISKVSIERRNILGPPSDQFFGWFLKILDTERKFALINTEGNTVYEGVLSHISKTSLQFIIELNSNRTISLKVKSKGVRTYKTLDETRTIKGKPKRGFAKMCDLKDAYTTIQILSENVAFNRSTLFPHMYISPDNKSISNTHLSSHTRKEFEMIDTFQDILLLYCRTDHECVYVINFRTIAPQGKTFSLILTNYKFLPSSYYNITLLSYDKCSVTSFMYKYDSFCLYVDKNIVSNPYSVVEMTSNIWHSVTIIVHKNHHSATFFFGNTQLYIQDGFIFESDFPVLRWIVHDMNANVEVRLGAGDEFSILTWFYYKLSPYIIKIQSFFNAKSVYILFALGICNYGYFFDLIIDLINFLRYLIFTNQDRINENEPRIENNERRRRGRRQRIR